MAIHKAYLESENGAQINCLFNPTEFSVSKSNSWQEGPNKGKTAPDLQFSGGGAGSMSLELFFDTTATGKAVTEHTNKLLELMRVDPSLPGYDESSNTGRPPWVKFHWGDVHSFKAIVENINVTYTYFSNNGVPLRARASVTLKQYEEDLKWSRQNPTSGTPDPGRLHRVQRGETLDRIAATHYGDGTRWRPIAVANGIIDPLALQPGTILTIPKRTVVDDA